MASGIIHELAEHSARWPNDEVAQLAPEEVDRVNMLQRGVSIHFMKALLSELEAYGRG